MVWCDHCLGDSPTELDHHHGYLCCTGCGKVIEHFEAQVGYNSPTSEGSGGPVSTGRRAVDRPAYRATNVLNATSSDEDNLSDIDDREVARYLHSEKEKRCKTMIWEFMNKDYLKEQEAKAAALTKGTDASTKSSKVRKRRYSQNTPGHAVAKATNEAVDLKGHSSKINYDALRSLLDQETDKKARTETYAVDADANARKVVGDETAADEDIDGDDYDRLLWE